MHYLVYTYLDNLHAFTWLGSGSIRGRDNTWRTFVLSLSAMIDATVDTFFRRKKGQRRAFPVYIFLGTVKFPFVEYDSYTSNYSILCVLYNHS